MKINLQANGMISTISSLKQRGEGFEGRDCTAFTQTETPTSESLVNEVQNPPNYRIC